MTCENCDRFVSFGTYCYGCQRHGNVVDEEKKIRWVQLWQMLGRDDRIQPGDCYSSSLCGGIYRCTPDMMGKELPYLHMPHLRPAGVRVETLP